MDLSAHILTKTPDSVLAAASLIRLVLLDVDGVLTDGKLYYGNSGEELKAFNIQDGLGIKLLQRAGIEVGVITGRQSSLLERRANDLGMGPVIQGREDKSTVLAELCQKHSLALADICFIGDDLTDLKVIRNVGLGICVANANAALVQYAHWQTYARGGEGAVREVAEMILAAQGTLDNLLAFYL